MLEAAKYKFVKHDDKTFGYRGWVIMGTKRQGFELVPPGGDRSKKLGASDKKDAKSKIDKQLDENVAENLIEQVLAGETASEVLKRI